MPHIQIVPLGAGQDVGRSCIIVSIGGKNVMFDCGMHMGYSDERRFPNFRYLSPEGNFDRVIDCVIISHFHLDHCGALPYFTEICGYNGPVIMTYPTKSICPIMLEDFRKITVERKGETNFFTSQMIKDCIKKVIGVNVHQSLYLEEDFEIKAFYAGHVLGAAMFYVRVGLFSCLYTGDYNMTPDRHLGSAHIDQLNVDLLITETTYATTIRDSKRLRERSFLKKVHQAVERGGKVLIPVFALGRAQELSILIETYWERMNLGHVPVYFSAGLVEKANLYYKLFINWTNEKIKDTFVKHNMFDFKYIKSFDRSYADRHGPMVLFATPGMLHAGMSLDVFKKWCGNPNNACILPGYCVAGTVGNKILSGSTKIEIDKKTKLDVRLQVCSMSFSAHADAKGIMQLIQQCQPKNVMLVHGERGKMQFLKERIQTEFNIPCYDPANGQVLTIDLKPLIPVNFSREFIKTNLNPLYDTKIQIKNEKNGENDKINLIDSKNYNLKKRSNEKISKYDLDGTNNNEPDLNNKYINFLSTENDKINYSQQKSDDTEVGANYLGHKFLSDSRLKYEEISGILVVNHCNNQLPISMNLYNKNEFKNFIGLPRHELLFNSSTPIKDSSNFDRNLFWEKCDKTVRQEIQENKSFPNNIYNIKDINKIESDDTIWKWKSIIIKYINPEKLEWQWSYQDEKMAMKLKELSETF